MIKTYLSISDRRNTYCVPFEEIIRLEAKGIYTVLYTVKGEEYICSKNLGFFCKKLKERAEFIRVHHSHLININKIRKHEKSNGTLIMVCGSRIPVAHRRKHEIINAIS